MNKKINTLLISFVIVFFAMMSCKKNYFDTVPDDTAKLEDVFKSKNMSENWLAKVYSAIPDIWNQPYSYTFEGMTNDVDYTWSSLPINNGSLNADGSAYYWQLYYQAIRNAGIFLNNIDKNTQLKNWNNGSGEGLIKQYKGEARFLRAYYYFLLLRLYGPIEILPDVPGDVNDNYKISRSPVDSCVNYIMSEMEASLPYLPLDHNDDLVQTGRITKPIVLAAESQVLLYAASPLFNGNTEFADLKNKNGTQLINQTYDANKWKKAADAAKAVIDLNLWQLYTVNDADPFKAAYYSVRNVFWDGWKTEGIWLRNTDRATLFEFERHSSPRNASGDAWNGIGVSQSLVDAFNTRNGKNINESGSGYTETGFTTAYAPLYVNNTSNMYANREARFYAYVTFNGATIPVKAKSGETYVGFFNTGNSGKAGAPRNWPKTGYTVRKNIHPSTDFNNYGVTLDRPAMNIRLSEIYLNYAEALNEYDPGNANILIYLNKVRGRAGIAAISAGISQDEMRRKIHNERRLELCFEGHRYFDVRRWKTAAGDDYQGGNIIGMNMDAGTSLASPDFYQRTVDIIRTPWSRKLYFWPAPQSDIDRNENLVQIPGY